MTHAALWQAVVAEDVRALDAVLASGTPIDVTDDAGFTVLHRCLDVCYSDARLRALLHRDADPNRAGGPLQETPLHVAVRRRRLRAVKLLKRAGAKLDATTRGGMTAYRHAIRRPFPEIARALTKLGAAAATTPSDDLAVALLDGARDQAVAMLAADPTLVPFATPEEARLVADLATQGKDDALAILLDAGADITARGLDGGTPLHGAAWFGQSATARLLIERGAPLDIRGDDHDATPLGWVAHGSRFADDGSRAAAYVEIAERLLAAGAPLPGPGDTHDESLACATEPVAAVLRRYGYGSA